LLVFVSNRHAKLHLPCLIGVLACHHGGLKDLMKIQVKVGCFMSVEAAMAEHHGQQWLYILLSGGLAGFTITPEVMDI
jgi:desulfoferrodoxin (superoxide reductase-like protein)